jgi:hypothetical protein
MNISYSQQVMIFIPNLCLFSNKNNSVTVGFYSFLKELLQLLDAVCGAELWRGKLIINIITSNFSIQMNKID